MSFDPTQGQGLPQDEISALVDDTIADNDVVLFMKGTPMLPQCGYSDRAVNLLERYCDEYETVDALQSLDEFRVALETHSGRTTIPQVFVDGEFVGGSDILVQLEERGELEATLSP